MAWQQRQQLQEQQEQQQVAHCTLVARSAAQPTGAPKTAKSTKHSQALWCLEANDATDTCAHRNAGV